MRSALRFVADDGIAAGEPTECFNPVASHAYAAAIDLNLEYSSYWLWQKKKGAIEYRNRMPYEIVEIFERHGFVWGGKWYHDDTMHFEYRPELIGSSTAP